MIRPRDSFPIDGTTASELPVESRVSWQPTAETQTSTQKEEATNSAASPSVFPEKAETRLGLTFNDQRFLGVLVVVMFVLMGWHWVQLSGWGMRPVEVDRLPSATIDDRIDINTATWVEFTQLDGIGETLAERIVADREQNGPFETVDDLNRVKGIGEKTLAKNRKYLIVKTE